MRPAPAFHCSPACFPSVGAPFAAPPRRRCPRPSSGSGDRRLVFALDRRVRDLKDVENTHRNVVHQVGQGAGDADKPDLAGFSQLQERIERAVLLQGLLDGEAWNCTTSR